MTERTLRRIGRGMINGSAAVASFEPFEERGGRDTFGLIGESLPMREVHRQVSQVADTGVTVLIRGESGTGKELIAQAIHGRSRRARGPFVSVNCAALPPSLIEAELFGFERGAFTGAVARRGGLFERAEGGTLFLDEIGDLDTALQVKLLRVLQEREVQRIGSDEPVSVDVRVVAATHQDLEHAMEVGTFREDLYYRLNVFTIHAPPLRDRRTDIPLLAEHFMMKHAADLGRDVRSITGGALAQLMGHPWPGNIRELENTIVRALLACGGRVIEEHDLTPGVRGVVPAEQESGSLADRVGKYERRIIEEALDETRGNRAQAARLLKTTERILGYRLRQYGIDTTRYRD